VRRSCGRLADRPARTFEAPRNCKASDVVRGEAGRDQR
jgi:hypothetical protein